MVSWKKNCRRGSSCTDETLRPDPGIADGEADEAGQQDVDLILTGGRYRGREPAEILEDIMK